MSICVCVHICVNNTRQEHERAPGAGQARCQLLPAPGVGLARCKHRLIRVHPGWGRSGPDGELGTATSPGWWLEKVRGSPQETQGSRQKEPKQRQSSQSRGVQSPGDGYPWYPACLASAGCSQAP